jgi:hypothetical protein
VSRPPVTCTRTDLGCTASHPDSKFDCIRAVEAGWFHSKVQDEAFCPGHLPEWVPGWRAQQAKLQHEVRGSYTRLPAVLRCSGCKLEQTETDTAPEFLKALNAQAYQHGRETGHTVTVTTTQVLTIESA